MKDITKSSLTLFVTQMQVVLIPMQWLYIRLTFLVEFEFGNGRELNRTIRLIRG